MAPPRTGLLTGPLRDQFGYTARLEYDVPDLQFIIERAAGLLGVSIDPQAAESLRRVRADPGLRTGFCGESGLCEVVGGGTIDVEIAPRLGATRRGSARLGPPGFELSGDADRAVPGWTGGN